MNRSTGIAEALHHARGDYDNACKRLLSEKQVLARIMKTCIPDYRDVDAEDIAQIYIEGETRVGIEPVGRDAERIQGLSNEDSTLSEGKVFFDIRFDATLPGTDDYVRIELDVEAQRSFYPGYPLTRRAVYYCGRMLSQQGAGEVVGSHYERVRKVYSIWVCTAPPKGLAGTITRFALSQSDLVGHPVYNPQDYDLLEVIMICLGVVPRRSEVELLGLLQTLLDPIIDPAVKVEMLKRTYGMIVSEDFESEVSEMCNLSEGVLELGIQQGIQQGIEQGIQQGIEQGVKEGRDLGYAESRLDALNSIMKNLGVDSMRAAEILGISADDQERYRSLLAMREA